MNWLGVLCALLLPALGILNRDSNKPDISVGQLAFVWVVLSIFLLLVWFLNSELNAFFSRRNPFPLPLRVSLVIGGNMLMILLFFAAKQVVKLPVSAEEYGVQNYQLFIRLCIATVLVTMIQSALQSMVQQEVLKRQNEQLRNENLVAELEGLKQQINPHFLFNSLGTLRAMIHEKDNHAEQFVLRLSAVYRQFLSKGNEPTTTLSEELDFLENYLFMLRFRYEDQLVLTVSIDSQNDTRLQTSHLPAFCLQLLVENCLKHNRLSTSQPLSIRIYQDSPHSITVENNRQPKQTGVDSTGIGLDNLRKRYTLLGVTNAVTVRETDGLFAISVTLLKP